MVSGREDEEFMKLGVQYYVAARSAVMAKLLPVCGNLYHHSLEMFLKAGLSRHITLDDLKHPRKFGHIRSWTRQAFLGWPVSARARCMESVYSLYTDSGSDAGHYPCVSSPAGSCAKAHAKVHLGCMG